MSCKHCVYAAILGLSLLIGGCGYNTLQQQDEQVKSAWSEVLNQYQRRADLVPNLVNVVKGAVAAEKDILDSVVEARSKATSIQATPELINDPAAFQKWQAAQGELSSALSRLMVVVERYPDLKSISGFNDLTAQLEGTENRIAVARKRYIDTVQSYNTTVRSFPTNLTAKMFGHDVKPNFSVENEAQISRPPAWISDQLHPLLSRSKNRIRAERRAAMLSRLLTAIALIAIATCAVAQVAVPPLRGPVTDLTGTLTSSEATTLDSKLRAFEARKGSQVAVLIVPTTQPETLEAYSIRVAEAWKLGRRGINDGVLLLVAKDDRGVRIEVGYALEGALPDVIANRITDQVIVPRFRTGDYFGGINEAVDRIIAVIEGEPLPERPATTDKRLPSSVKGVVPIMLMLIVVGGSILRRMLGSFGGAAATAGVAGFLIWILTSSDRRRDRGRGAGICDHSLHGRRRRRLDQSAIRSPRWLGRRLGRWWVWRRWLGRRWWGWRLEWRRGQLWWRRRLRAVVDVRRTLTRVEAPRGNRSWAATGLRASDPGCDRGGHWGH